MKDVTAIARNAHRYGLEGETATIAWLTTGFGIKAVRQPYGAPYDIDCSGVRVEVKTSQGRLDEIKGKTVWAFNLHRHGVLNERCDFYIFRLENVPDCGAAIHLVIPAPLKRPTISITIRSLMVRWGRFYNDLEPLQKAIEQKRSSLTTKGQPHGNRSPI